MRCATRRGPRGRGLRGRRLRGEAGDLEEGVEALAVEARLLQGGGGLRKGWERLGGAAAVEREAGLEARDAGGEVVGAEAGFVLLVAAGGVGEVLRGVVGAAFVEGDRTEHKRALCAPVGRRLRQHILTRGRRRTARERLDFPPTCVDPSLHLARVAA